MKRVRFLAGLTALLLLITSSAFAATYTKLQRGDNNSDVKAMQQALSQLGYALAADGNFGSGTEKAVRAFQLINGLTVTGVADESTLELIYQLSSGGSAVAPTPSPSPTPVGSEGGYQKLQLGSEGQAVTALQQALKQLGYSITVDGSYGTSTQTVVKAFQRDQKLSADGIAGAKTQRRLFELVNASTATTAPTASPTAAPAAPAGSETAQVTTGGGKLNLRDESHKKILTQIPNYAYITVTKRGSVWCDVIYNGQAGCVMTSFLTFTGSSATQAPATVPTTAPSGNTATVYTQNGGSLNLRIAPSGKTIKSIPNKTTLVVTQYGVTWCGVVYNGTPGYVMTKFLTNFSNAAATPTAAPTAAATQAPTTAPTVVPLGNTATVHTQNGGTLNLRKAPSGKTIRAIPNKATLTVTQYGAAWCAVTYEGTSGYVMTKFLTNFSNATTAPTTAPTVSATQAPATAPTIVPGGDTATVYTSNGGTLNLRNAPSGKTIKAIPNKATLTVTQYGTDWCAVMYEGTSGYVMTKFLTNFTQSTPTPAATATPAPTAAPSYDTTVLTRTLKSGYTGADVKLVQQRLSALNYLKSSYINSTYDSYTIAAVKSFQRLHGLTVDGLAGKSTFEKLFSANAVAYSAEMEGYSSLHIYYENADSDLVDDIERMQARLIELGYTTSVSGKFDANTYMAVLNFQLRNGLTVDGVAGPAMQTILFSSKAQPASAKPSYELEEGAGYMQSPAVSQIELLHWQDEIKPNISSGQTMLVYDPVSKLSWNLRIYAPGRHCDSEPLTLRDTLILFRAFGKPSWDIHAVYIQLPTGQWTMATMHNYPHLKGGITDNGFDGHVCVHFLRDMSEAQANDPNYGVNNQKILREAWKSLTGQTVN